MTLFEEATQTPVAVGSPLDGRVVQRIREMLHAEFERTSHALSELDDAVRDLEAGVTSVEGAARVFSAEACHLRTDLVRGLC